MSLILWYIISVIISIGIFIPMLFFSYKEVLERENTCLYWRNYDWKDLGEPRVKCPLWMVLLASGISLIPFGINVACSIMTLMLYCHHQRKPEDNFGDNTRVYRLVVRMPLLTFIKRFLNTPI